MRRFVTLDCLVDSNDVTVFSNHAVQNLRRAVLAPAVYQPRIQQELQRIHFNFHRTCSYTNLIRVFLLLAMFYLLVISFMFGG